MFSGRCSVIWHLRVDLQRIALLLFPPPHARRLNLLHKRRKNSHHYNVLGFFFVKFLSVRFLVAMLLLSSPAGSGPRCTAPARICSLQSQGQCVYEPLRARLICQLREAPIQRRHCAKKVSVPLICSVFARSHFTVFSNTPLSLQMLHFSSLCALCHSLFPESLLPFTY